MQTLICRLLASVSVPARVRHAVGVSVGVAAGLLGACAIVCPNARAQEGFGNNTQIVIPAGAPGVSVGVSAPYPSPIVVTGLKRPIAHVSVVMPAYSHTCSNDVAALLVGPQGQTCLLVGRCGGCGTPFNNVYLSFDDNSMNAFPAGTVPQSVGYRPGSNCNMGGASFAAPAPVGPYGGTLSAFRGTDGNGSWKLYVQDFAGGDVGSFTGGWAVFITEAGIPVVTAQGNGIAIPAGQPTSTQGIAGPYPGTILVSGITGRIASVSVRINSITHTYPRDIDVLLVGPNQQSCVLMSDAGGGNPGLYQATLAFTDNAPGLMPQFTNTGSGTFRPTDHEPGDVMPFPAPPGPYGTSLSVFTGSNPNGYWSLYINDDLGGDWGITSLWDLTLYLEDACKADFNASGVVEVQDIFDFLSAWFAGC